MQVSKKGGGRGVSVRGKSHKHARENGWTKGTVDDTVQKSKGLVPTVPRRLANSARGYYRVVKQAGKGTLWAKRSRGKTKKRKRGG